MGLVASKPAAQGPESPSLGQQNPVQFAESAWVFLLPRTDGLTIPASRGPVTAREGAELIPSPVPQELCPLRFQSLT